MRIQGSRGIVVVGAAKAASTTIAAAIATHPDVAALDGEYFGFVERADDAVSVRELGARCALLPQRSRYLFKCAAYLADSTLPRRLRAALGDIDVVVVLRDPVERAVSAWYWSILCGFAPAIGHEAGIRALLRGELDLTRWPHAGEVLSWGEYARMLKPWIEEYGPDRLHIVTDAEVLELPDALARLRRGLDLSTPRASVAPVRLNRGVYSLTRLRWLARRLPMRWHVDPDGVWRCSRPTAGLDWLLDTSITAVDRILLKPFARGDVHVSTELDRLLQEYYRTDQAHLRMLVPGPTATLTAVAS